MKKRVQLAFAKADREGAGFNAKLIAWWTNGPYSHVELLIHDYNDITYMWTASSTENKVRKKIHKHNPGRYDYIDLEMSEEDIDKIERFFKMIEGQEYDWLGIMGFVMPALRDRTTKWFCSECVSNAIKITGDERFWLLSPSEISPNDLAVIVGLLEDYQKRSILTLIK